MILKTRFYRRAGTNAAENLAIETFLTESVPAGTCVFYLWQNRKTVVVGRNQNAWKECRVDALEADAGFLARRMSGGGAVFHDLGNLNFTFCVPAEDYDLDRQLGVVLSAVRSFGVPAEKSGRNDILVGEKKISGNAFLHRAGKSCHHGTLMVNVDTSQLARYLNVPADKLAAKGVESVRSRIANLVEIVPELTIETLCEALFNAFKEAYGSVPEILTDADFASPRVAELTDKFASWDWRLGQRFPFSWSAETRFAWGGFELRLCVEAGKILRAVVFSDALDEALPQAISGALAGAKFSVPAMLAALAPLGNVPALANVKDFLAEQKI